MKESPKQGKCVATWPMPHTEMESDAYRLEVDGVAVPVWLARVREAINKPQGCGWTSMLNGPTEWCSFARFDARYPATATVTVSRPFATAQVLPHSAKIAPEIDGNRITFSIDRPCPITITLDGNDEHPLHLFCREIETDIPVPDADNVVYFGPGEHWIDTLRVKSGQTVYIDGGSVLRAVMPAGATGKRGGVLNLYSYGRRIIDIDGVENVRICGRGIIDGSCLPHPAGNLIRVSNSRGVCIEGITLRNSPGWHLPITASEDVTVNDLACISGRLNSDGVNCVSSSRVTVRRTFVRSHDDSFVVKTTLPDRPSADILYEDCVAWNDWGYALGVSYETRSDIRDIVFRNCDVVFARNWPLGVHVSDGGTIGPVLFENIGVYYPRTSLTPHMSRQAVQFDIVEDVWGKDDRRGRVRDVTLRNVSFAGENIPSIRIAGHDAEHRIEDVLFENVSINGKVLKSPDDHIFDVNEHVKGLTVHE